MGENKDTFAAWQAVRESRTSLDLIRIFETHNHNSQIVIHVKGLEIELTRDEAAHLCDLLKVSIIDHEAFEASWKASRFNKEGE